MGELIPFPQRPREATENIQVQFTTTAYTRIFVQCQGFIHVFAEVPGQCECGENYWGDDVLPESPVIGIHEVR